ncbi:Low-density lipoprotein receptor- protein 12 [Bulinus truncatus]|nr:Low-density lipoprotein receptor- protein 12 [Bulinus truncatus]
MDYKRILWFLCSSLSIATSTLISDCLQIEPILTLYKGFIESPYNSSQNYPENTCIKWVLLGKPGMKLTLNLSSGDSIKIYDGSGYMATLIGSYGWIHCPNYVMTTKSSFYIQLVSLDKSNIGDFSINFIARDYATTTSQQLPYWPQYNDCRLNISSYLGEITMNDDVYIALRQCGYFSWHLNYLDPLGQYSGYNFIIETLDLLPGDAFYFYDEPSQTPLAFRRGLTTPYHFTSSGNSILIRYIPKPANDDTRANFTIRFSVSRSCPPDYLKCNYGESTCYPQNKHCDGFWDCPVRGGDEKDCQKKCGPGELSCNSTSGSCYKESERCNGKESCSNYADEIGCSAQQCSADKGLFLCANGRCIYEKWHCDRTSDCTDNSDELDCSPFTSPRVIVAAVVGSLICVLLLVISLGCVCKLYNIRVNSLRRGTRHETPLSRQLAEMFHRRAPPPPYHEAMLTSRPYDEAYMELLAQAENGDRSAQFISSDQSNAAFIAPRERSQRDHSGRRCRHNRRHRDVNQVTQEVNTMINVDSLTVGTEMFNALEEDPNRFTSLSQLPAYSEMVPPVLRGHDNLESSGESDDGSILEHWQSEDNNSQASLYRDSQLEITSHDESPGPTFSSVMRNFQHTLGTDQVELQLNSDKDIDTASTNHSLDSTSGDKMECERDVVTVDDDSDSDCILAEDDDDDDTVILNDDLTSDTVCLLSNV